MIWAKKASKNLVRIFESKILEIVKNIQPGLFLFHSYKKKCIIKKEKQKCFGIKDDLLIKALS